MFTITADERASGPHPTLVVLLCAIFLLAGIVGHDPWKSEDAIHFGVVHGFLTGGDWRQPAIAGEAYSQAEPLYYWVAATIARATQPLLPLHDGARLATALFGLIFLFAMSRAASRMFGPETGWGAPLLVIGTVGLLVPMHESQPTVAMLATMAVAYWGAACLVNAPLAGSLLLGMGVGTTFLAGGLNATLPLVPLLLAPLFTKRWSAFPVVLILAGGIAAIWPLILSTVSNEALQSWWAAETTSITPGRSFTFDHVKLLAWVVWPIQFIALWMVWFGRYHLAERQLLLPLIGVITTAVWFVVHDPRPLMALFMVPPLALLATAGTERLKRGAANAWDWFGMMTFTLVVALIWLGAIAMLTGWPPKIAHNFAKLAPGFNASLSAMPAVMAAIVTTLWLLVLARLPRSPWRVASRWAAGMTIMWALLISLWLPWIDYGKTYRPVMTSLANALPEDHGCIARRGVGLPLRSMLDYFGGVRTRWNAADCQWLITEGSASDDDPAGWQKVWEGNRPGDKNDRLRLYRKSDS